MGWLAALLFGLWITPLRLGAAVRLGDALPRAAWGVMVWGVPIRGRIGLKRDAGGRLRLTSASPGRGRRLPMLRRPAVWAGRRFAAACSRPGPGRRLLKRGARLVLLDAEVRLGGDAARAAVLTGLVRAAAALLPRARLHCFPVPGGRSALRARCIVDVRLGTLWTAALMGWLIRPRAGRKEEA